MMRKLIAAVSLVAMVGCSGSVNGTVGGVSLSVADAIFAVFKDDAGKTQGLLVVMADKPNICTALKANREPKSATSLSFSLFRVNDSFEILAPDVGDYTVKEPPVTSAGSFAYANFARTDSNCTNTLSSSASTAKSGLVKLTALKAESNGTASGTIDMTIGAGDKITGNFNATFCDITKIQANPNCE